MTQSPRNAPASRHLLRDAIVTFLVVLLAYGALDDITTDSDTSFVVEWVALAACAAWFIALSWGLLVRRHRWLGSISMVAAVGAVGAGAAVRPGVDPFQVEFLVTVASLLWFLALAAILAGLAWWAPHSTGQVTAHR